MLTVFFIMLYLLCMLAGCRLLKGRCYALAVTGCLLCLLLLVMLGWKSFICHYYAGSIMAVFTEAKTHGVRRICWPDNASRDLSDQHLYL
ncbi:transporter [Salmonella enterica subsp. enterica]|uniref:Transporter n=1 Tax=Salmonella enterica I TaxID=59201 RepID=A0A3S4G4E8_SALET|nr:transporter [Salmonella enterica subsp. enterica]